MMIQSSDLNRYLDHTVGKFELSELLYGDFENHQICSRMSVARKLEITSMETGPWIVGGAPRRVLAGIDGGDIDLFMGQEPGQYERIVEKLRSFTGAKQNNVSAAAEHWTVMGLPIHLVTRGRYERPEDVFADFDFTVCQIATDGYKWVSTKQSRLDASNQILGLCHKEIYFRSFRRLRRYTSYGFLSTPDCLTEILRLNLNDPELFLNPEGKADSKKVSCWNPRYPEEDDKDKKLTLDDSNAEPSNINIMLRPDQEEECIEAFILSRVLTRPQIFPLGDSYGVCANDVVIPLRMYLTLLFDWLAQEDSIDSFGQACNFLFMPWLASMNDVMTRHLGMPMPLQPNYWMASNLQTKEIQKNNLLLYGQTCNHKIRSQLKAVILRDNPRLDMFDFLKTLVDDYRNAVA